MAAANEQVTAQPNPTPVTTPAAPIPAAPANDAAALETYDGVLVLVVLVFAFLVASYAANNSDFFFQAATGRMLLEGRYHFGEDPFASTTENVYWANHSWLFGLIAHAVYDSFEGHGENDSCVGGVILVVAKALLIAWLTWMLIAIGRKRGWSLWIPTASAAVAILAMSPRLLLNPTTLSFVFLGLTLYLLRWPRWNPSPVPAPAKKGKTAETPAIAGPYPFKAFWVIPPLCALWVNIDGWFLLGPLTVALYLAGECIEQMVNRDPDRADRPAPGELQTLGYVLLASVAACFLSPHHYHAWTLPAQLGLSGAGQTLRDDSVIKYMFLSPFDDHYYDNRYMGKNAAGWAYFPLLLLGLVSFVVTLRSLRWWRLLIWLPFAALSAAHLRAIPFFAVVCGPIMALNFLDFAEWIGASAFTKAAGWRAWRVVGRLACIAGGLALVVCAIPGWLQATPQDRRRVAWCVHVEESWRDLGKQLAEWRNDGKLKDDDHWFNAGAPEVAYYLAYYAEGRYSFLDGRLNLFDATAEDYEKVWQSLQEVDENETPATDAAAAKAKPKEAPKTAWREVFPKHHVRFLILHHPEPLILNKPVARLLAEPEEWTPLYADGETIIMGWTPPTEKPPLSWSSMRLNYNRQAFGPQAEPLPRKHAPEQPRIREWYEALWEPEKPRALVVKRAVFDDMYQTVQKELLFQHFGRDWEKATRTACQAGGAPMLVVLFNPRLPIATNFANSLELPPPAPWYLCARQIQQSLADTPDDAKAYLQLGIMYFKLLWDTKERERGYMNGFPHPALIRHTQIVTALNRALKLDPNLEMAHVLLAAHYAKCRQPQGPNRLPLLPNLTDSGQMYNFLDVELQHAQEQLRLSKERGKPPEGLEEEVKRLNQEVEIRRDKYTLDAANKGVIQRALSALKYGLGEEAQSVLEKADVKDLFTTIGRRTVPTGALLRIKLLLSLGRVEEVSEFLADEKTKESDWGVIPELGMKTIDWFQVLVGAATGDYEAADKALETLEGNIRQDREQYTRRAAKQYALQVVSENDYASPFQYLPTLWKLQESMKTRSAARLILDQECQIKALRGWLALEAGDIKLARTKFGEVLEMNYVREGTVAGAMALGSSLTFAQEHHLGTINIVLSLELRAVQLARTCLTWIDQGYR